MIKLFMDLGKSALHPQSSKLLVRGVTTWANVSIAVSNKATRYQASFVTATDACGKICFQLRFEFKLLSSLA